MFDTADRYVGYSGAVSSATRYQVGVGDCDKEYYLHIDRSAQGQPTTPAFTDVSASAAGNLVFHGTAGGGESGVPADGRHPGPAHQYLALETQEISLSII